MRNSCRRWYHDPTLVEHLASDTFWALGIILLFFGYWMFRVEVPATVDNSTGRDVKETGNGEESTSKCDTRPDSSTKAKAADESLLCTRLRPYITTRKRQILAIGGAGLLVPLYLLEGFWALKTAWRVTAAVVPATFPGFKPRILGFILYSPMTALILASWLAVLTLGVFLLAENMLFIDDLRNLRPGSDVLQDTTAAVHSADGDSDWNHVESEEKSKNE